MSNLTEAKHDHEQTAADMIRRLTESMQIPAELLKGDNCNYSGSRVSLEHFMRQVGFKTDETAKE